MKTQVLKERDYVEWHGGIEQYGFWCMKISDAGWLQNISELQGLLQPILLAGYSRFAHITVATVGLMSPHKWSVVERQMKAMQAIKVGAVHLGWRGFASYHHSPIIRVYCQTSSLTTIRACLHQVCVGDDNPPYDPHITLGYYAQQLDISAVYQSVKPKEPMDAIQQVPVTELLFCTYNTTSIKGPIKIQQVLPLE